MDVCEKIFVAIVRIARDRRITQRRVADIDGIHTDSANHQVVRNIQAVHR